MKSLYKVLICLSLMSVVSCTDFLDVNDNQNQLVDVPSGILLLKGTMLANVQVHKGQLLRSAMYYSGQLRGLQLVQQTIYNYSYTPGESNDTWLHVYNGILVQNKKIRELSPELDLLQGIIDVNEALAVGTAATLFGDIPYSTAVPDDPSLTSPDPVYDTQETVYSDMQNLLDRAINTITNSTTAVGSDDIYYGGNKNKWLEAANTLKARYYLLTKQYGQALNYVGSGISSPSNTLNYNPIGAVNENSNIFYIFVNGSRAGDMTGNDAFYRNLLDPGNPDGRNHDKTDETARRRYSYISGNGHQNDGIDDAPTKMPIVSFEENLLIWAECLLRDGQSQAAIDKLNELRAHLNSGIAFNVLNASDTYKYEAYVMDDFSNGGIENPDNIATNRAILREIIEERYVTGFTTYMPFNDVRRLRASDSDVIVPFGLNTATATMNPQRFLYPRSEIDGNTNVPSPLPDLFQPTPVNQ